MERQVDGLPMRKPTVTYLPVLGKPERNSEWPSPERRSAKPGAKHEAPHGQQSFVYTLSLNKLTPIYMTLTCLGQVETVQVSM